jgi:drug/metabolite transporter (DMT)-like permease
MQAAVEPAAHQPGALSAWTIQPVLGVALALGAVTAGVGMDVLAKFAALDASPAQVTLLRWAYGVLTLLPAMLLLRVAPGSPWRRIHLWRLLLNFIGSFCLYHALAHLPLSVTVSIFFLEPLVAMGLAALFLGERLSPLSLLGSALALLGILIMTGIAGWQTEAGLDPASVGIAMLGAAAWGGLLVVTRRQGRSLPVLGLMFWLSVFTALGMAPIAWADWQPLDLGAHFAMLGVAACGTVYGILFITVLCRAPVRVVASCSFLSLPLAFLAGFLFFGETIGAVAAGGGVLVVLGVWLALHLPPKAAPAATVSGSIRPESP